MTPQAEIFSALSTDTAIKAVVSNDLTRISNQYPPVDMLNSPGENFPRITFVETSRAHIFYTDNTARRDRIIYSVSIWISQSELANFQLSTVGREVDRVMIGIGYRKTDSNDETFTTEKVSARLIEYMKDIDSNR